MGHAECCEDGVIGSDVFVYQLLRARSVPVRITGPAGRKGWGTQSVGPLPVPHGPAIEFLNVPCVGRGITPRKFRKLRG
jgi:hypothetical protein